MMVLNESVIASLLQQNLRSELQRDHTTVDPNEVAAVAMVTDGMLSEIAAAAMVRSFFLTFP